jgi:hypothetical protein
MSLPKINHHLFKITIPSTKKSYNFRPYTVKEEKLLLMMKDSEIISDIVDTIIQIINNCCVDTIDTKSLAIFDIEYIFIKLRAKSVGEEIELVYTEDDNKVKLTVDLDKVEVKFNPDHSKKLALFDDIGVTMRYPSYKDMIKLQDILDKKTNIDDFIYEMLIDCVENVYDDKQVYNEFSKEEIEKFVLSLPMECSAKFRQFFDTMPALQHEIEIKLKDNSIKKIMLRGLKDFFIL